MGRGRVTFLDFCPDVESDGFGDGLGEGLEFDLCHVEGGLVGGDCGDGVDAEERAAAVVDGEFPDARRGVDGVGVESDGGDGFQVDGDLAAWKAEGDEVWSGGAGWGLGGC